MNVRRGDIYYADLSPVVGSEQGGVRPVLIVQNDVGNRFSPTVIAAAITSQRDKTNLPTHIALHAERTGLQKDSIVLLEQVRTIDKHTLNLSQQRADQVKASLVSLGVSESRLTAIGMGCEDPWHIKGAGLEGQLASSNIKVVLLDAATDEAQTILDMMQS